MVSDEDQFKKIHGTSVAIEDNGILILGQSGSGKSDLALRLIDSGATLISDDITFCQKKSNIILLFSNKKIRGLIEVRGMGLITVPYIENIKLKIIIKLTSDPIERLPENSFFSLQGVKVPSLDLNSKEVSACAKVKLKLYEENQKK